MKKYYVTSTMTADVTYHGYVSIAGEAQITKSVLIKGGSNVANSLLITPIGIQTEVDEDDLEFLKKDVTFQAHVENGFISYEAKEREPEVVAASGMQYKDKSAPKTPEDFKDSDTVKPEGFSGKKGTSAPLE
jgi:hypothetical protein